MFYRLHDERSEFCAENAYSCTIDGEGRQDGYSCCESIEDLIGYWTGAAPAYRVCSRDDQLVIEFSGEVVGEGADGEPLVMPDMEHVRRMTWGEVNG
jgi:hypothetical protein